MRASHLFHLSLSCLSVSGAQILTQLDFAPLPSGSDPLLLRWFGQHASLWTGTHRLMPLERRPASAAPGGNARAAVTYLLTQKTEEGASGSSSEGVAAPSAAIAAPSAAADRTAAPAGAQGDEVFFKIFKFLYT